MVAVRLFVELGGANAAAARCGVVDEVSVAERSRRSITIWNLG